MYEEEEYWLDPSSADVAHDIHLNRMNSQMGTHTHTHTRVCARFILPPIADTVQPTSVNLNYTCK